MEQNKAVAILTALGAYNLPWYMRGEKGKTYEHRKPHQGASECARRVRQFNLAGPSYVPTDDEKWFPKGHTLNPYLDGEESEHGAHGEVVEAVGEGEGQS